MGAFGLASVLLFGSGLHWPPRSGELRDLLLNHIEAVASTPSFVVRAQPIRAARLVESFYELRNFQPAWTSGTTILPTADSLVASIRNTEADGLDPNYYHLAEIENLIREIRDPRRAGQGSEGEIADLELLLTDAFLVCASHLSAGRLHPETLEPRQLSSARDSDLVKVLEQGLATGQVGAALTNLKPSSHDYERLKQAYLLYRTLALRGEGPLIPEGPKLQREDRGARVTALRSRLAATGDLDRQQAREADAFDEPVEQGIRQFQWRHGLVVDGVAGPETVAALNVPAEDRARRIALNMERWRWQPREFGSRYILVNVADFGLEVVEEDDVVLSMRTVVGRPYRRTPVFSARMTYLVFSPFWQVPPGIAGRDILPRIRKDADYLSRERIRVFQGWGPEAVDVDPASVDWNQIEPRTLPYRFRQDPGPSNPLGGVKFMFPNRFNVYLHDTPSKELFDEMARAFSSGCIRVEKASELALYLLRNDSSWTPEEIHKAMGAGWDQTVSLPEPIVVHLRYWTAWVDRDGAVHFRDDIYQQDKKMDKALSVVLDEAEFP